MTTGSWPFPPQQPDPPGWPDRPSYPYPPLRPTPRREGPLMVPVVDVPHDDPVRRLFARRRVLVSGPLDAELATRTSAELMALDGQSADDVELAVNSGGGRFADVLGLLDVMALMRARVHTTCIGRAMGTAAVLVACGTGRRRAAPHAMISLRCSEPEHIEGSPDQLRQQLAELELVRQQVVEALATATGQPAIDLAGALDDGQLLDPAQAAELGIIDALEAP